MVNEIQVEIVCEIAKPSRMGKPLLKDSVKKYDYIRAILWVFEVVPRSTIFIKSSKVRRATRHCLLLVFSPRSIRKVRSILFRSSKPIGLRFPRAGVRSSVFSHHFS